MSLKIVVDMNLSVEWVPLFLAEGWQASHWSTLGDPRAEDAAIMQWAIENKSIVFTHDLDSSAALALTGAAGPSILQLRGTQVLPENIGPFVLAAIRKFESELIAGALVVVEVSRSRVRVLPL